MFRRLLHNCSHGAIGPEDYVDTSPTDDLPQDALSKRCACVAMRVSCPDPGWDRSCMAYYL